MPGVTVVKRKSRRPPTSPVVEAQAPALTPSVPEKAKPPLPPYTRASFTTAIRSTPLWANLGGLTPTHIENFGEPTKVSEAGSEYVLRIPTREILKIVVKGGQVTIWGFHKTPSLERWIDRLLASLPLTTDIPSS